MIQITERSITVIEDRERAARMNLVSSKGIQKLNFIPTSHKYASYRFTVKTTNTFVRIRKKRNED